MAKICPIKKVGSQCNYEEANGVPKMKKQKQISPEDLSKIGSYCRFSGDLNFQLEKQCGQCKKLPVCIKIYLKLATSQI